MNEKPKFRADMALEVAQTMIDDLRPLCRQIEIAGSLRRGKSLVSDVELVALPLSPRHFLARLDMWVVTGRVRQAQYQHGTTRWGERYRGMVTPGGSLKIEVFIADPDNYGLTLWLRTGPGEANEFVMRTMLMHHAPFRSMGGYLVADGQRIHVPTEEEWFRLLGIAYLAPAKRSINAYQRLIRGEWAATWTLAQDETPSQPGLF